MSVRIDVLTDDQLISAVHRLAKDERTVTASLIRHLAEMDARRIYLREGCASLFAWCTEVLHLSEAAAYNRIEVARIGRRFPSVFDALEEGTVNQTTIKLLGPYLTSENCDELLASARHKTKRQIEQMLTGVEPISPAPAGMRETTIHLAPGLHEIRFTITTATRDKLERARELLRHSIPNGEYAAIFDKALTVLLARVERRRTGAAKAPRPQRAAPPRGRAIPAAVKRAVWKRDGGRCAFVGSQGRRCTARAMLEYHHRKPFARGGATTTENLSLRCRQHNQYEAGEAFGPQAARKRTKAERQHGDGGRGLVPERVDVSPAAASNGTATPNVSATARGS